MTHPTDRWLSTSTTDDNRGTDAHKKKQRTLTPAQKRNARLFALLPALLRMFEASEGHLMVPYSFLVPKDWADGVQGLRLRCKLNAIATKPKHQKQHPRVVSALRAMGIPMGEAAYRKHMWEQETMLPLKTFYAIHGHTLVPHAFQVPSGDSQWPKSTWGYKLGNRVTNLRQRHDLLIDAEVADLATIEFSLNVWETTWSDRILPALETYARVRGNCLIPNAFVVPHNESWPRKAWGLPLGSIVGSIRSAGAYAEQVKRDRDRLESISFVYDHHEHVWSEIALPSMEAYYRLNGHSRVPKSFVVPSDTPWPEEAWGHKLGVSVVGIRAYGNFSAQVERDAARLEAIDFAWDASDHKWRTVVLPALETFAAQSSHCDVPNAFVVPSESPWPKDAWGLKLGVCVANIRTQGYYRQERDRDARKLDAIGFVWDSSEHKWTRCILPSFETFRQLNGHCNIPKQFVVPSESPWPKGAWGLKLGLCAANMRCRGNYHTQSERDAHKLKAIGFVWDARDNNWTRRILPAFEAFYQVHGHTRVSPTFVVPSSSPWPQEAWGLQLGATTDRIKRQGAYAAFVVRDEVRLAAIGFEVDPSHVREKNHQVMSSDADVEVDDLAM